MNTNDVLVNKLTTALGRIDAGSAGGYEFRHHVAKADLLPVVNHLLAEARRQVAEEIAVALDGNAAMWATPDNPPEHWDSHHLIVRNASQIALQNAAKDARKIGGAA